jgi:hypothetical protein
VRFSPARGTHPYGGSAAPAESYSSQTLGNAPKIAHMLDGYSLALHIDGSRRPDSYAVREHLEDVLGTPFWSASGSPPSSYGAVMVPAPSTP